MKWTEGFWADRFEVARQKLVPHVGEIYMSDEISHAFKNFEIAAGLEEGTHDGPSFHDGDFYKWLEGAASLYASTKDASLDQQMDEIIDVIAQAHRDDGYIYTPVLIAHRNGDTEAEPLQASFETYTMGHLMTAAAVHYRATGKKSLLEVAVNLTEYLYEVYKDDPHTLANNRLCPSHYMGTVEIYRTTGDPKFLELAKGLIDIRPMVDEGNDDNQDRIPFREQEEAVGHAVRGTYLYAAVADLYAETGDQTLLEPLEKIWKDLVQRKLYVTGASGALYDGVSPDGVLYDPSDVHQVHQAWGRPYQLPSLTAHNETCANIGNLLWAWRMFQIKGETEFTDIVELTLYNSILSGVSLDGERFLYTNPLRVDNRYPKELRWGNEREEYISRSNCCPPNVVRTVAQVHNYAYSISENGLWINLYGGNEL
ncbi:MAG TPA: beta-L-arabinofuranosidase domain-containing protein, partial [Fodinibius sp.]|nr:beta-L-arabinofuranosidase domain-containing protein [Fodinibius sp.]